MVAQFNSYRENTGIDPRLLKRGLSEDQIKMIRDKMGDQNTVSCNIRFKCDLKELRHPSFDFIYTTYEAWRNHHALPFSGAYSEQPNQILEFYLILDELKYEEEKKARAQAEREMKKRQKKNG